MKKIILLALTALTKHLWWRKKYHLSYITSEEEWKGRCLICDAGKQTSALRCDSSNFKDCPCKMNQRLVLKQDNYIPPKPKDIPTL